MARRWPVALAARACVGLATFACCAALGSCAVLPGVSKPKNWAGPLAAGGEWNVHLPLRNGVCARGKAGNDEPVDTATFELTQSGELTARSAHGVVAALGGCSCVASGFLDADALVRGAVSVDTDDVASNVKVNYGSAMLYGRALVTTVEHCMSCTLSGMKTGGLGCWRFTHGGEDMQGICDDLARRAATPRPFIGAVSPADAFSPLPYLLRTNYTYLNGVGTCCMTHQHAATLVSIDDSEAVFMTEHGHPLAADACGRLTVLRRKVELADDIPA